MKTGESSGPAGTQDDTASMLRIARELEAGNPLWIVVFGVYSRQFIAFPRFSVPAGTMVTAHYPAALTARMHGIEHAMQTYGTQSTRRRITVHDHNVTGRYQP
jgi:hypothetical protein